MSDDKPRLTSQRICNLYPAAKLEERKVTSILQRAGVPNIRSKGYEVFPATGAIIAFYKHGYEERDVAGEGDRARKNRSEADLAELERARQLREICFRQDYRDNYADAIARGVQEIDRIDMPARFKEAVFAALRTVRLAELEDEE